MSFLYCTYIVLYALLNPLLGRYVDRVYNNSGETDIHPAIYNVAGVQFTVLCVIMLLATLIPKVSRCPAFEPAVSRDTDGCLGRTELQPEVLVRRKS